MGVDFFVIRFNSVSQFFIQIGGFFILLFLHILISNFPETILFTVLIGITAKRRGKQK